MTNANIPNHVAIIMDGNGRWAKERNLSRSAGHRAGMEALKKISCDIFKKGIKVLSVFAFSTENFKRSKEEVDFLMNLFIKAFNEEFEFYKTENIKIVFSGRKEPLPNNVLKAMQKVADETKENTGGILNICINYGGHFEIIDACKKYVEDVQNGLLNKEDLTEEKFEKYLYQELPPIDLLIRTSGEERISNFMLWQLSYAELYFANIYFPDFDTNEFDKVLCEYQKRTRKFGGVLDETKNN